VFRIGGNTFYDQKKNLMKNPEFKRSRIGLIAEFCLILNGFPNQAKKGTAERAMATETAHQLSVKESGACQV
jgi:hypothetical protein